ncbi:MAG: tetratricopeptide repeat protein [Spirochaetales bacterium]|nr:tetratricopeptide repeat protein [Spirochaetales bacterium]
MKKLILCFLLILPAVFVFSQNTDPVMNVAESDHYRVSSQVSIGQAADTAEQLDAYFDFFNHYFHFDTSNLSEKLNVRLFSNKIDYDNYLSAIIKEDKESFVFLQYNKPSMNELVGYTSLNSDDYSRYIVHQAFIQFIKTFVPNPPLWMVKGFAIYLEKSVYNEDTSTVQYRENLSWLYSLKKYIDKTETSHESRIIPISTFLTVDVNTANTNIDVFYAQSWGLIYFLMNSSNESYNRLIWDSINAVSPDNSREENDLEIMQSAFGWINKTELTRDFNDYFNNLKTFPDMVQEGKELYGAGRYAEAERIFINALSMDDTHPVPYYYLGLINYAGSDYKMADYYYKTAIQMGGKDAITSYALGVNAYADSRYEEAIESLIEAYQKDKRSLGKKAANVILEIDKEHPGLINSYLKNAGITRSELNYPN